MSNRRLHYLLIAIFVILVLPPSLRAQDENEAALVISFGDGRVESRCVSFSEPEITGFELLERSGLNPEIDVANLGAQVCRIDGTGCPPDDCWCDCRGGGEDCIYWSYWHRLDSGWQYSQAGAGTYPIGDGAVDGWVWGLGAPNEAEPPPEMTFDDICAASVEPPTETPVTPSPTAALIATPAPTATEGAPTAAPTDTPLPSPTVSPTATDLPFTPSPSPSPTSAASEGESEAGEPATVTSTPQPTRSLPNVPTPTRFRFPTMTPTGESVAITIISPTPPAPLSTSTPRSFEVGSPPPTPSPVIANPAGSDPPASPTPISTLLADAQTIGGGPEEIATRQAAAAAASRATLFRRVIAFAAYFVFAAIVLILLGMLVFVQWRRQSS